MLYGNVLEAVGHTPMIRLKRMAENGSAEILVKYEGLNVGGSIKTRTALNMIEDGERRGLIGPDTVIVEPTSGNQGIGLALDADDAAIGGADGQAGRGGHHTFGVTEKVEGEPAQGQSQDSGDRPAEAGKNKGRQGRDADGGPAFGGDAARSRAHALSPDGMEN